MKDVPYRVSLEELSHVPHYRNIVAAVAALSPVVPAFDHRGQSNIETIKYELARRAMHESVMNILNPKGKADG